MKRYIALAVVFLTLFGVSSMLFDGPDPPPTCDPIVGCPDGGGNSGGGSGGGGGGGW